MKRSLLVSLAAVLALAGTVLAQGNPRGKAEGEGNGKAVTGGYGRPSLHGRTIQDMLGQLPAGGFWRLGADSSSPFLLFTSPSPPDLSQYRYPSFSFKQKQHEQTTKRTLAIK